MSVEFFHGGESRDDGLAFLNAGFVVANHTGATHKVGHTQATKKTAGAAGRQHMTRAGGKITEGCGRVITQHDRSGRGDIAQQCLVCAFLDEKFEMLGSDVIRDLHRLGEVFDFDR